MYQTKKYHMKTNREQRNEGLCLAKRSQEEMDESFFKEKCKSIYVGTKEQLQKCKNGGRNTQTAQNELRNE